MAFYIIGLGNPGEKYALTRHNTGRIILDWYLKEKSKIKNQKSKLQFKIQNLNTAKQAPEADIWKFEKKTNSLKAEIKIGKNRALLMLPETFMNNSGNAVSKIITSKKKAQNLIVIHDDLDLTLGKFKIVFNRGSGGHKGTESIIRAIKTEEFVRIKVGITPATPLGKLKKPRDKKLLDFITADFKPPELKTIKKISPKIFAALDLIIESGLQKAMNKYN